MKYFRVTDLTTNQTSYTSSSLPNESVTHMAISLHLDPEHKYDIQEISYSEFTREMEKVFTD